MKYALSTVGQGSTCYISISNSFSVLGASEGTGGWFIRRKFKAPPSLSANLHLVGSSSSTAGSLRVLVDGTLRFRNASIDLIDSVAGAIVAGNVYEVILRRVYTPVSGIELLLNGVSIGVTTTLTSGWLGAVNQIDRFSTSLTSESETLEFEVFNGGSSYSDLWNDTTAPSLSTVWPSASGLRNLIIMNPAGAADTWWVPYGAATIVDSTFEVSAVASVLLSGQKLHSTPVSCSGSAGITLQSVKLSTATMTAAASVFFGLNHRKQGTQNIMVPISAAGAVMANKGGVSTLSIPVAVEVGLYSGAVIDVAGTFSVSATAAFSFQSSKVTTTTTHFSAAATLAIACNKAGIAGIDVNAAAAVSVAGAKSTQSTLSVVVAASITINGQNLSAGEAEQWPVDVVFIESQTRYQHAIASNSPFEYHVTTHSSGGASV